MSLVRKLLLMRVVALAEKERHRRIMRWGILASLLQLGSAYAAARALFSNKYRQRLVAMDLRSAPQGRKDHLPACSEPVLASRYWSCHCRQADA